MSGVGGEGAGAAGGAGSACWRCGAAGALGALRCAACGALQPEPPGADLFSALGLSPAFALDLADLEARFRERSRLVHPDRFARASPREQRIALERATRLNLAYRALREPRRRAAHLLERAGLAPGAAGPVEPGFLEEQLALRERLAEARARGDAAAQAAVATLARGRLDALDAQLARLLCGRSPGPEELAAAARLLERARFLEATLAQADPDPAAHRP